MNRIEKRAAAFGLSNQAELPSIYDLCLALRASANGMSDHMALDDVERYMLYLRCCLDTWEKSNRCGDERFDNAVKEMIEATIVARIEHACRCG